MKMKADKKLRSPNVIGVKQLAFDLYGGQCAGDCGERRVSQVFLTHRDELLDADAGMLRRGKAYRLSAFWHLALHEYLIDRGGPKAYAPYCWGCFKRVGRSMRRAQGIRHWKHKKAIPGFNCVLRDEQAGERYPPAVVEEILLKEL
jgi:hypothetical protein